MDNYERMLQMVYKFPTEHKERNKMINDKRINMIIEYQQKKAGLIRVETQSDN